LRGRVASATSNFGAARLTLRAGASATSTFGAGLGAAFLALRTGASSLWLRATARGFE